MATLSSLSQTKSSNSKTISTVLITSAASISLSIAFYYYHKSALNRLERKLNGARLAERRGRIRAEVSLRTHLKAVEQNQLKESQNDLHDVKIRLSSNSNSENSPKMLLKCIGTLHTPFTKRMGTPRQGALVPSSRAFLQLDISLAIEILDGIQEYSHCWVVFEFHANTNLTTSGFATAKKSKIRPPRASGSGNQKVGILATRSPHRPNPVGLSLVKVNRVDTKKRRLYIEAIDLVHGTPVYDIKPCVPWDIPGHHDNDTIRVPSWVSQKDALPTVSITETAKHSLYRLMSAPQNSLSPLYNILSSNKRKKQQKLNPNTKYDKFQDDDFLAAQQTIKEVLAQDPRSTHKRGTETESVYSFVLGKINIEFSIINNEVLVEDVKAINLDEYQYIDGIPLIGTNEEK